MKFRQVFLGSVFLVILWLFESRFASKFDYVGCLTIKLVPPSKFEASGGLKLTNTNSYVFCRWSLRRLRLRLGLREPKLSQCRVAYYSNSMATKRIILLSGDIELNPGWHGTNLGQDYLQDFAESVNHSSTNLKVAHINIRSLRNKVDEVKLLLQVCRFDVLAITETFLDRKISNQQIEIEDYKIIRRDRKAGSLGGGCLIYIANHICSTRLKSLETSEIEGIWIRVSVNSTSFIIGNIYRPPSDSSFFDTFHVMLEKVWVKYKNVVLLGDFNCDFTLSDEGVIISTTGRRLQRILQQLNYTVVNEQPTRVTCDSSTLIDLVISNKPELVKSTSTLELAISDHMLVFASVMTKIKRPPPKIIHARTFKRFDEDEFKRDIEKAPWSVCSVFDDPDDCYWAWSHMFNDICQRHAPFRQIKIRRHSLPWITPQIRHMMNLRFKTLLKAKKTNFPEHWAAYRVLRNRVTHEVRSSKSNYYMDLFNEVKDCKSYWRLVKQATNSQLSQPIMGIRRIDGKIETADEKKAEILNEHFTTIGEKLAMDLPANVGDTTTFIARVTPTKMNIDLSYGSISKGLEKLKANKACGPDRIAPKLIKKAGDAIIPSLMNIYLNSAASNTLPVIWKSANVASLYKKMTRPINKTIVPFLCCVSRES